MREKVYRIIIAVLVAILAIVIAGSGWLRYDSNRNSSRLAEAGARNLALAESYRNDFEEVSGRFGELEKRYNTLTGEYRELGEEISVFNRNIGTLASGLLNVESGIVDAQNRLREDSGILQSLAGEIGKSLEAVEGIPDVNSDLGRDVSDIDYSSDLGIGR